MEELVDIDMSYVDSLDLKTKWQEKFTNGTFVSSDVETLWRQWVPKLFTPCARSDTLINKDELTQKLLLQPLEEFICNGDPNIVLSNLSQTNQSASVCGKVFKMGEPTYSCRECGMDKTCVLCVDCFKLSQHRFHKYKMGTSGGGGCCDCGDYEAWKKDPCCTAHSISTEEDKSQPPADLPQDMKTRTKIIFETILSYAFNLLNPEQISDIRLGETSDNFFDVDSYCTILYNDEVHTFEQVIATLTRVLKCNQKTAIEYVTNIDREGRSIVKCSSFKECSDLKQEIEKYTSRHGGSPLKVLVNHSHIIAHQRFAMKLLTWLQGFLGNGPGFRTIFAEISTKSEGSNPCLLKGILLRDSQLWKNARAHWHRLLISGLLLEYEHKKTFAKIFTKNYGQVLKDFIKDDHDHAYSIASMSVQLFTVPTLAHHLIAHDDVLYILMNTLKSECSRKCNKLGKLEFERTQSQSFKRALYTLYDLRYLLSFVPETWTDDLRRSFLHGLSIILELLTMMQGMDAATRQVGQHMEYEPEWESGFNLHIKLSYCISLALQWCATDKVVLVKAYRTTLRKLEENPCYDPNEAGEVRELADHSTACLHYDVASRPVSIHLPLSRFLAGLHLHLEKFNLHYDVEFQLPKPTPVQIIEPVLRTQVMIAQVHAGMWRRNGYALLNTLFFYHNVKCRTEMLDRDITLLQVGASLIESNEFLIHVINKCNLINWAMPDFEDKSLKSPEEDSIRQTINLVEEMLHLLIVIIGERYMPGISDATVEDRAKKELIQQLCIKPLPHSELTKSVPEDLCSETAPDDIIKDIANFKRPSLGSGIGVYELKNEFYEQYNAFFYHYTREELSKSEETQRMRRKAAGELECCPPPKLLKLKPPFLMLANLLQCDVMLYLMQTVLQRCSNLRARSFSEPQLQKVLYLIGYALHEEESKNYEYFKFIENSEKFNIYSLLNELMNCKRVDAHKDLLKWTLNKYKEVANVTPHTQSSDEAGTSKESESTSATENDDKERRAKLVAERRAKLLAQMTAAQNNFMKENAKLFEDNNAESESARNSESIADPSMDFMEYPNSKPVALGPKQSQRVVEDSTHTCILCQDEVKIRIDGPTMVLAAFVQQSTVLCQHKNNEDFMDITKHNPFFLHANLGPAHHVSTCGHVMHNDCWRKYFDNIKLRENRRPYRLRHPASFDIEKHEFLCPLCECLSNTVLPLIPAISTIQPTVLKGTISFDSYLECLNLLLSQKNKVCHGAIKGHLSEDCENQHCETCLYLSGEPFSEPSLTRSCEANSDSEEHEVFYSYPDDMFNKMSESSLPKEFIRIFPKTVKVLDRELFDKIRTFTRLIYPETTYHQSYSGLPPMVWKSLAYTIHSVEVLLRDSEKPLMGELSSRQRDCLINFVRLVAILGSTLTPSVVLSSHATNLLVTLLEHPNEGPSILQWDSFGYLVSLTYALPDMSSKTMFTPCPTGGTLELHTLRLIFISHIVKILILMDIDNFGNSMDTDEPASVGSVEDHNALLDVLKLMTKFKSDLDTNSIWNYVQYAAKPFLRCCVLFYHYLTDVPAPSELTEYGGDTFANMCEYLDLPQTPTELFSSGKVMELVKKWSYHEEVQLYLNGTPLQVIHEPLPVNKLIDLPEDYSELINMVSSFTCPNSDEDSRNPTMCLVCGEILCSQSYCCQVEMSKMNVGACNYHAYKCGSGVGIFLRVRECEILFLATPLRGCFMTPPYLDEYGETDQGLRRGNPLKLCKDRYKKLQALWLKHSLHEEIARAMETSSHPVATQWSAL